MAGKSDYLESKLLDFVFRGQTFTQLNNVYVGLYTVAPSDAGGGTEVSGGSYARVAVSGTLVNWSGTGTNVGTGVSSGSNGTIGNINAITFPSPTGNWGTVTNFGLFDASTTGNLLYWAALTTPKTINNGDAAPSFAAGSSPTIGALTITED